MTEKRFIITDNGYVYDQKDGAIYPTVESVVKSLNDFNDENEQLKVENGEMEDYLGRLEEENEQLKKDLKKEFIPFARADEDGITKVDTDTFIRILQENDELKQQIRNMAFILRQNGLGLMEDDDDFD